MSLPTKDAALAALRSASQGLQFQSETDAPFETFFWPDEDAAPLSPERVLQLAGGAVDAPIESTSLATFFKPATQEETWHNDEEKAEVARFKALVGTIKSTLQKPQVWKLGETSADVYIAGGVEGGHAGLKTQVVET